MQTYYFILFVLSALLTGAYMLIWKKHYDVHLTLVFGVIPVTNLGFLSAGPGQNNRGRPVCHAVCLHRRVLPAAVHHADDLQPVRHPSAEDAPGNFAGMSAALFLTVQTIGRNTLFYRSAELREINGRMVLVKEYGIMHTVFQIVVIAFFVISIGTIIYSLIRKNQVSRKILVSLLIPDIVCMLCFFLGRQIFPEIELTPAGYVFAQICYLFITYRISLYSVADTAAEAMVQTGDTCFITFDTRFNYLGSNSTAKKIFPELRNLIVDLGLRHSRTLQQKILPWLEQYRDHPQDAEKNRHFVPYGDKIYLFTVKSLPARRG